MEELIDQALAVAKGMWRFRWQSLLVAWIVGIVAVVLVFRVPDEYEATAFDLDHANEAVEHAAANGGPFKLTVIRP